MIGFILFMVGISVTGNLILQIIRKIKRTCPDVFKKYHVLFVLAATFLFFLGVSLSLILGGMANGAAINFDTVKLVVKFTLLVIAGGVLTKF